MIVDLHNHTPLCNHAKGSIDEYIKAAIKAKTKYFGFSDHAPMEFDKNYRMSFDDMGIYELEVLRAKGVSVGSPEETLKEVARRNGITPARVYETLLEASGTSRPSSFTPGSGLGKMKLKELCSKIGLPPDSCLEVLKRHGITASLDQSVREAAFSKGIYSYQLVQMLQEAKRDKNF
jgi:hypothetical protein